MISPPPPSVSAHIFLDIVFFFLISCLCIFFYVDYTFFCCLFSLVIRPPFFPLFYLLLLYISFVYHTQKKTPPHFFVMELCTCGVFYTKYVLNMAMGKMRENIIRWSSLFSHSNISNNYVPTYTVYLTKQRFRIYMKSFKYIQCAQRQVREYVDHKTFCTRCMYVYEGSNTQNPNNQT